jgi:hypothetical protein
VNLFDIDGALVSSFLLENKISHCYDNLSQGSKFYYYYPGIEYYYRMKKNHSVFIAKTRQHPVQALIAG